MSILVLIEVLVIVGFLLWLINAWIPMQANIKTILNGVIVFVVIIWLLHVFGIFDTLKNVHV